MLSCSKYLLTLHFFILDNKSNWVHTSTKSHTSWLKVEWAKLMKTRVCFRVADVSKHSYLTLSLGWTFIALMKQQFVVYIEELPDHHWLLMTRTVFTLVATATTLPFRFSWWSEMFVRFAFCCFVSAQMKFQNSFSF